MVSAIQLLRLSIGYPRKHTLVLDNLDLELYKGQFICLLGANGSGKSTLLRTLAGFQPALSGEIRIEGKLVTGMSKYEMARKMSVVLTDRVGSATMTVKELVSLGRYPHTNWMVKMVKEDHEAIRRAIEATGIEAILQKPISELSDGQLQKALIARALAQDGPIMILDEPSTHLDLNNRVSIMRLLHRLASEENKLILVATHELDLALQMADRFLLINNGEVETGIPEDMVLSGVLDRAFQLKGYDLKTGRAFFEPQRKTKIRLSGEGYHYLWTRNALERSGFAVSRDEGDVQVESQDAQWRVPQYNQSFTSLEPLITFLLKIEGE